MSVEHIETLVIGGGQAGLTMSHMLSKRGCPHLVLERGRIAERWRSERWDGLCFILPNWRVGLPDFPFPHTDPDGFTAGREIVDYIAAYADFIKAPVRCGVEVTALRARDGASGFIAETTTGVIAAENVVCATGPFQCPIIPPVLAADESIFQVHARDYKNPKLLPAGAILVVGAGASGAQIAEELRRAGRKTYLSISRHWRGPRRYRSRDLAWWGSQFPGADQVVTEADIDTRGDAHTGAHGGYTIDYRRSARQGMVLLGRAESARDGIMQFGPDLMAHLAEGDASYLAFLDRADALVASKGLVLPDDPDARIIDPGPPDLADAPRSLDLRAAGIGAVVWATGYRYDFGWITDVALSPLGVPLHDGGVGTQPGLYLLGLRNLHKRSSALLHGVGEDAARLAAHISKRVAS